MQTYYLICLKVLEKYFALQHKLHALTLILQLFAKSQEVIQFILPAKELSFSVTIPIKISIKLFCLVLLTNIQLF